MRQKFTPATWLIIVLTLALFLVACERPLQDEVDLTLEPVAPSDEALPGYPGAQTPAAPGLLPTPTTSVPQDSNGEAEQPAGEEPTDATGAEPTPAGPVIHTVVAGDTLGSLATQYDVTIEDIAAANELSDIHSLDVGQQLLIPIGGFVPEEGGEETAGEEPSGEETTGEETTGEEPAATAEPPPPPPPEERVHTVGPGDTLFRIGQQYGFTIEELATFNNLANPDRLEVGQQIRIPPDGYTIEP